jgi:splicing factor 3A subunit 1
LFVARSANPPQFEDKIRENQRQDPKFSFLNPADPYHAYYRHRMDKIAAGEELEDTSQEKEKTAGVEEMPLIPEDLGVEPPQPQFVMDMPNVSHIDLCVPSPCPKDN